MQKLYCYVDESGQDTQGKLFLVSVVIPQKEREELREKLEAIEKRSKKGTRKWFHTNRGLRDQSDAFIRLADAIAGFARDYLEGNVVMQELYKEAIKKKIIKEI